MANKNFEIKNGLTVAGTERITSAGVVTGTTATQSASDNTTKLASTAYVTTALANLSDSAPSTLNTLNELAAALGDDANYATTTTNAIAAKLPLAGGTLTGNLLIGTTDAGYPSYGDELTIGAASGNNGMTLRSGTSNYGTFYFSDATGNGAGTYAGKLQYNHANNSMVLATNSLDRLTIDSAGQVGIGTTSPSAQLDVQVSSNVWAGEFKQTNTSNGDGVHIRIGSSAAADYGLRVDTNAGNTPGLVVKGDGNVGIGTFTPNSPLVIQHSHQLTDLTGMSANSTLVVGNTGSGNNVYNALHLSGNQQSMFIAAVNHGQTADRRLGFFLGSAAGDALTDERLSIRGDGNVGIGIVPSSASSTTRLQIHHVDNTAILQLTNGGGGGTGADDGGQVRFDDNENMYVVNKEAGLLVLSTSNTDRLTIKADGKVCIGIGTGGGELNVKDQLNMTNSGNVSLFGLKGTRFGYSSAYKVVQLGDGTSSTASNIAIGVDLSGNNSGSFTGYGESIYFRNAINFRTPNSGNDGFHTYTTLKDGNFGIGITTPEQPFHVYQAGDGKRPVRFTTGNNKDLDFYNDSEGWQLQSEKGLYHRSKGGGQIRFITGAGSDDTENERMRIDTNGQVTTPQNQAFRARATTGQVLASGWKKVGYDSLIQSRGAGNGGYSTSTSRFTALVDGWYQFNAQWTANANSDTDGTFSLWINGSSADLVGSVSMTDTGANHGHVVSGCCYLAATHYVEVYRYSSVSTTTRTSNPYGGWFSGYLIG